MVMYKIKLLVTINDSSLKRIKTHEKLMTNFQFTEALITVCHKLFLFITVHER